MIVIDPDAVHGHAAVVVVPHTASVAHTAMVHPWQFEHLALLTEPPSFNAHGGLKGFALKVRVRVGLRLLELLWQVVVGVDQFVCGEGEEVGVILVWLDIGGRFGLWGVR